MPLYQAKAAQIIRQWHAERIAFMNFEATPSNIMSEAHKRCLKHSYLQTWLVCDEWLKIRVCQQLYV